MNALWIPVLIAVLWGAFANPWTLVPWAIAGFMLFQSSRARVRPHRPPEH